jgi:NAD(P)-dependent dehydrogenase (short-subunit alcohol dehydrogenase family)
MINFDGRVVIVTGGGRGLGRSHCLLAAERGARVVVNDLAEGDEHSALEVVDEIRSRGGEAIAAECDITETVAAGSVVNAAVEAYGTVDALINNAGIVRSATFPDETPEMLMKHFSVHVVGTFNVSRAVWPIMRDKGTGRIVMTSSCVGMFGGDPAHVSYATAKGAIIGLAKTLATIGADQGINVNVLSPTGFTRMAGAVPDDVAEFVRAQRPPELVSPMAVYLAHERCTVSGEIFWSSGGEVSRIFHGETYGFYDPKLSLEHIDEHWAEIRDQTRFEPVDGTIGERPYMRTPGDHYAAGQQPR